MLCEMCGKNQATFFYKQTKNGYTVEKNLCAECAKKQGLGMPGNLFDFGGFTGDDFFGGLLGSFVEKEPKIVASETCPGCGMTLGELLHGGRVGCMQCYSVFRNSLMPTVTKIHGNVAHCGKVPVQNAAGEAGGTAKAPSTAQNAAAPQDKLSQLREKLRIAIDRQEYEDAAKYRDEIRAIEQEAEKNTAEKPNPDTNSEDGKGDDAQ